MEILGGRGGKNQIIILGGGMEPHIYVILYWEMTISSMGIICGMIRRAFTLLGSFAVQDHCRACTDLHVCY